MEANKSAAESPRITRALAYISSMLVDGEQLRCHAVQQRLFALKNRRAIVSATSGRLIGIERGFWGGFLAVGGITPTVIRYQDIKDVTIQVGIFGSQLEVTFLSQPDFASEGSVRRRAFVGLRKNEAQAVYRICQVQEQGWREKRRLRELEELRARSGGIQMNALSSAARGDSVSSGDVLSRLQRAKELLAQELISDSEYETIKARLVNEV